MKNVDMKVKGNQLTLTIDLSKSFGSSSSGKSDIIATTAGNQEVAGHENTMLGITVFKALPKEEKPKKTAKKNGKKRVAYKVSK